MIIHHCIHKACCNPLQLRIGAFPYHLSNEAQEHPPDSLNPDAVKRTGFRAEIGLTDG